MPWRNCNKQVCDSFGDPVKPVRGLAVRVSEGEIAGVAGSLSSDSAMWLQRVFELGFRVVRVLN